MVKRADRSLAPRRPDFNRLYQAYCEEKYGSRNGVEMFANLDKVIEEYKDQNPTSSVRYQPYLEVDDQKQPFILTVITPLMHRVHEKASEDFLNEIFDNFLTAVLIDLNLF